MNNNFIRIDLRQLPNQKLWDLSKVVNVDLEAQARGFNDVFKLETQLATYFGIYATKEEYINSQPMPEDTRGDGGC